MDRPSQRIVGALGGFVAVLVAVLLLLQLTATDPVAAAKAQAGAAGASLLRSEVSDSPVGGHATVRLRPSGEGIEPIEIRLRRPFWSRYWRRVPAGP